MELVPIKTYPKIVTVHRIYCNFNHMTWVRGKTSIMFSKVKQICPPCNVWMMNDKNTKKYSNENKSFWREPDSTLGAGLHPAAPNQATLKIKMRVMSIVTSWSSWSRDTVRLRCLVLVVGLIRCHFDGRWLLYLQVETITN